jgi:NitT/TauT family transport system permease protein
MMSEVLRIRLLTAIGLLVAYEALAQSGLLYKGVIPSLLAIGKSLVLVLANGEFYGHLGLTIFEMAVGFSIGTCTGLTLGIAFGLWRMLGETLDPWVHYLAPAPKIIFLPVLVLAFGAGVGSKIAMGSISSFFPVVVATYAGMRLVRPVLIRVATSYQASTWQIVRYVYLPSLVAPVIGAMRIGLGATIIGTLLAEIKMSRAGLGYLIIQDYNFFRIPEMYALLVIIFALAWLANSGMEHLGNKLGRY